MDDEAKLPAGTVEGGETGEGSARQGPDQVQDSGRDDVKSYTRPARQYK